MHVGLVDTLLIQLESQNVFCQKVLHSPGNTTILLQYSTVTTKKVFCKMHCSYRAQGLTMLGTGVKGGYFGWDVGSYRIWMFLVLSWALF